MIKKVIVNFYGHAMFTIGFPDLDMIIGFDPYNEQVKEDLPDVSADIAFISHSHFDHSNIRLFKTLGDVIDSAGKKTIKGIDIEGIKTFHDKDQGSQRGENNIYKLEVDGFKIAHLGDLGEILNDDIIDKLKGLDILMIPVGGNYTIDHDEALEMIKDIEPKIAIPMHFKEKDTFIDVNDINVFKKSIPQHYPVKEIDKSTEIMVEEMPLKTEIWIMYSEQQ